MNVQGFPRSIVTTGIADADLRHMSGGIVTVTCAVALHLTVWSHVRIRDEELKLPPADMAALALKAEASPAPCELDALDKADPPEAVRVGPLNFKQRSTPFDTMRGFYNVALKAQQASTCGPHVAARDF